MFLQKYVQEVDEQLARLIAARDKIASLAGPALETRPLFTHETSLPSVAATEEVKSEPAAQVAVPETAETVASPAKRRGRPKGSRNKTTMIRTRRFAAPEPRALTNTVPAGPVVVSPAQLAKRHEPVVAKPEAPEAKPDTPGGGLDALIREVSDRRMTSFSPAA